MAVFTKKWVFKFYYASKHTAVQVYRTPAKKYQYRLCPPPPAPSIECNLLGLAKQCKKLTICTLATYICSNVNTVRGNSVDYKFPVA